LTIGNDDLRLRRLTCGKGFAFATCLQSAIVNRKSAIENRQFDVLESGFEEWLPGQVSTHPSHPNSPSFGLGTKLSIEESGNAPLFSNSTPGLFFAAHGGSGNPAAARVASGMVVPIEKGAPLVAIVGPTAAGKSALALALAESLDGEIVNYDSVQLYQGFDIGSGKLAPEERRGVPHHLLDCLEAEEQFTAGDYRREALRVLAEIRERARLPVFVGGTGLYLRAVLMGLFDGPTRSEELRGRLRALAERRGRQFLHRLLKRLDPEASTRIQPRDTQKTVRALEVCILARTPMSKMQARGRSGLEGYRVVKVGLHPERRELYQRINSRVEWMFARGLVEETRALLARQDWSRLKALGALGYRQASAVTQGQLSLPEAILQTQVATRRYAKRQMTWFRHEAGIIWFGGFGDDPQIQSQVINVLRGAGIGALRGGSV
jgi:tRNA dimethylallyltransferase